MSRSFCSHSSDCIEILNLSSFYLPGSSFRDDRAIQTAIQKIKSGSDFFTSECLDLLQKAVDWSISFAAGSDARKTAFLQDISQGKDKEFLRDVLNTYRSNNKSADLRGRCGYSIGSREYLNYVERKVLLQDLPAIYSDDYDGGIKDSLEDIARQLQRDLSQNERENNYITDDTARNLRAAVSELEHCGISTGISDSMIERLAWLDPLQSSWTGIRAATKITRDGRNFSRLVSSESNMPLFRADLHPYKGNTSYYHINVDALPDASAWQKRLASQLDHTEISKEAYDV